jgi:hypothetical protein
MWVKVDDSFPDHPKVAALSDAAFRLHISGLCYAGRYLTDGLIPETFTRESKLTKELVKSHLWDKTAGGWQIHDFLIYNPTRAKVIEEREKAKKRRQNVGETSPDGWANVGGTSLTGGTPTNGRTSAAPSSSSSLVADQELPADAGEEWIEIPKGWTDQEAGLYRKLFAQNPNWSALTPAGMNDLNNKHGKTTVTEALRRVYEEGTEPKKPYALLDSVCLAIKQQVVLDA